MSTQPNRYSQNPVCLTAHARLRMAQRNISRREVAYIMRHGRQRHRAGAILITLRGCDILKEDRRNAALARLEGATVVLSRETPLVLTVWRNRRHANRKIRRKPCYSIINTDR